MVNEDLESPVASRGLHPISNANFNTDPPNGNNSSPNPMVLTQEELEELSKIDSHLFGILKLDDPSNQKIKSIIVKAIKALEVALLNRTLILEKYDQNSSCNEIVSNLKTRNVDPKIYCRLGHYNLLLGNYSKALSAYQQYFKLNSNYWKDTPFLFSIGLVYFHYNAYPWAIKAFKQLIYVEPSFSRTNEVHVRLGLIFKTLKQFNLALKHFRLALNDSNPCTVGKQEINFHIAHLYEIQGKYSIAHDQYISILNENNLSSKLRSDTLRQLGWMNHVIESFGESQSRQTDAVNYLKASIEFNPDSSQSYYFLGRCYASLNKVHDAFMSYRQSVEKAEANADTWCSIGVLYQQQNQPLDALQAYICSAQLDKDHEAAWTNLGILYENYNQVHDAFRCYLHATRGRGTKANPILVDRLNFLKPNLANIPLIVSQSSNKLPSVEEAWNHSVSNEMAQRQSYRPQPIGGMTTDEHMNKRHKGELSIPQRNAFNFPQNSYQFDNLQSSQFNQHKADSLKANLISDSAGFSMPNQKIPPNIPMNNLKNSASLNSPLFNQAPKARSFRDSVDSDVLSTHTHSSDDSASCTPESKETYSSQINSFNTANSVFSNVSLITKEKEESITSLLYSPYPQLLSTDSSQTRPSKPLSIDMTAQDIVDHCSHLSVDEKIISSIVSDDGHPPFPPDPPYPPLSKDKLYPATPSVTVENKKDLFCFELQQFCLSNPIAVVRGLAGVLKLDLGLFSTKTLIETNSEHGIEVRRQFMQPSDENWDPEHRGMVWYCESQRSHTTIARYGQYQAASFNESLREERERYSGNSFRDSDSDSNSAFPRSRKFKKYGMFKPVKFGTNVDLSDEKKWKPQLQELLKLPPFARVQSGNNMLSHVGHTILGMNTVQLYMKVPGCRTPGHQENNNFCSVNINVGPGDCEWFGIAPEYWGVIHRICERNNINYLHGSWWPLLEDLYAENVPLYRFVQRPGDFVWVGAGTVHWVQAIGWCNNIAWNVGPFSAHQYHLAITRYEWNKHESYKSIVPMIHLTWNLAQNIKVSDKSLYELMRGVMMRSLKRCLMLTKLVKHLGHEIKYHGITKDEASHYCVHCDTEVFNILFVKEIERKHVVHCLDCARKIKSDLEDFVVLEEYRFNELIDIYDKFAHFPS